MSDHLEHLHEWREAIAASIVRMDSGETDNGIMGQIRAQQFDTLDKTIKELETLHQRAREQAPTETAQQRFTDCGGEAEADPIERLRFYCSLAMAGQDWLDAEPFFDALKSGQSKPVALLYRDYGILRVCQLTPPPRGAFPVFTAAPAAPDAHELWAAAQLVPGEGIEDGVARIEALLATPKAT